MPGAAYNVRRNLNSFSVRISSHMLAALNLAGTMILSPYDQFLNVSSYKPNVKDIPLGHIQR